MSKHVYAIEDHSCELYTFAPRSRKSMISMEDLDTMYNGFKEGDRNTLGYFDTLENAEKAFKSYKGEIRCVRGYAGNYIVYGDRYWICEYSIEIDEDGNEEYEYVDSCAVSEFKLNQSMLDRVHESDDPRYIAAMDEYKEDHSEEFEDDDD